MRRQETLTSREKRAMSITTIQAVSVPLRTDDQGVIRVRDSRFTLDMVIEEFWNGASPDDIVRDYAGLDRADVYAIIAWYLSNRTEADTYLNRREQEAARLWEEIEAKQLDRDSFKEKLLAR